MVRGRMHCIRTKSERERRKRKEKSKPDKKKKKKKRDRHSRAQRRLQRMALGQNDLALLASTSRQPPLLSSGEAQRRQKPLSGGIRQQRNCAAHLGGDQPTPPVPHHLSRGQFLPASTTPLPHARRPASAFPTSHLLTISTTSQGTTCAGPSGRPGPTCTCACLLAGVRPEWRLQTRLPRRATELADPFHWQQDVTQAISRQSMPVLFPFVLRSCGVVSPTLTSGFCPLGLLELHAETPPQPQQNGVSGRPRTMLLLRI